MKSINKTFNFFYCSEWIPCAKSRWYQIYNDF